MVTLSNISKGNRLKLELEGLSTDTKPTKLFENHKLTNGSTFLCIDTLDVYFYDEEHETWVITQ